MVEEKTQSVKLYWFCEECGYKDCNKPMPKDREKFYAKLNTGWSPKCTKCKSLGFKPVGY